nr:hypothetical protein [Pseudoclavibacter sp. Marseille-Q3772]
METRIIDGEFRTVSRLCDDVVEGVGESTSIRDVQDLVSEGMQGGKAGSLFARVVDHLEDARNSIMTAAEAISDASFAAETAFQAGDEVSAERLNDIHHELLTVDYRSFKG